MKKNKVGVVILSSLILIVAISLLMINKSSYAAGEIVNSCPETVTVTESEETISLISGITLPKEIEVTVDGVAQKHTVITTTPDIQLSGTLYSKIFAERMDIPTFSKNEEENRYYQQLFIWWQDNELTEEEKELIRNDSNGKILTEKIDEYIEYKNWSLENPEEALYLDSIDTNDITYHVTNDYIETSLIVPDCTKEYSFAFTDYEVKTSSPIIVVNENGEEQTEFLREEGFRLRIPISEIKNNEINFQAEIIGKEIVDVWGIYAPVTRFVTNFISINCGDKQLLEEFTPQNINYNVGVGTLHVKVIDAETKENLEKAEVAIYDEGGNEIYRYETTEEELTITLPTGNYTIKQIITPPNYEARVVEQRVQVIKDQETEAVLENIPLIEVPDTLKRTGKITMTGIILLLLGSAIIAWITMKNQNKLTKE